MDRRGLNAAGEKLAELIYIRALAIMAAAPGAYTAAEAVDIAAAHLGAISDSPNSEPPPQSYENGADNA
jgi:hypothetical protein